MLQPRPVSKIAIVVIIVSAIDLILAALLIALYPVTALFRAIPQAELWSPTLIISRAPLMVVASCEQAAQRASEPPAQEVSDDRQPAVSRERARHIADGALAFYLGNSEPDNVAGPGLLQATLSDGKQRLVWYRLWIRPGGNVNYSNNALVLYVDAMTGKPLVLFTGITVIDPVFAACDNFPLTQAEIARLALPVLAPILLGMALLGTVGLSWARGRLHSIRSRVG